MGETNRATAREIAKRHLSQGDALGWFEELYARGRGDSSIIPWVNWTPNPILVTWLDGNAIKGFGKKALKIGCGLGDDAETLAGRGFDTTAFDIAPTAIAWCRQRFPGSAVRYVVADLFSAPKDWLEAFDLVVESYTLQVLPPELRHKAVPRIANFVKPGGTLLVIARGRDPGESEGSMPWPLVKEDLDRFEFHGLTEKAFEDYMDDEDPPVRRFRAVYGK